MSTTADDRKRLALEFLDTLATRDVDAVLERMTDPPAWAFFAQAIPGAEGVRAIAKASSELYQEGSHERTIHAVHADGETDTVIVKTSLRAKTFRGEDYENLYIMIVHFEGEKIRLVEEFMDTAYGNEKFAG